MMTHRHRHRQQIIVNHRWDKEGDKEVEEEGEEEEGEEEGEEGEEEGEEEQILNYYPGEQEGK
jgi:hypothetical protein